MDFVEDILNEGNNIFSQNFSFFYSSTDLRENSLYVTEKKSIFP